nr:hypothetical protein Iba_scaffold946CG0030 [Ipomoea batatas]
MELKLMSLKIVNLLHLTLGIEMLLPRISLDHCLSRQLPYLKLWKGSGWKCS